MARANTNPYRLTHGTHRVPNPEFTEGKDEPELSHGIAQAGDVVHLTDAQFKSFKDKFRPLGTGATDARDADEAEFQTAKDVAAATGQNIDPNKPIAPQIEKGKADPFANARAAPATTK
jgi:hypothetical protein